MKAIFADKKYIEIDFATQSFEKGSDSMFLSIKSSKESDLAKVLSVIKNNTATITIEADESTDTYEGYVLVNSTIYNDNGRKTLEARFEKEPEVQE